MTKKLINKLGIGALGLALAGSFWGCDKENPEIVKYEEKGYVDFCDVKNKKVYTDLGKTIEIIDAPDEAKNYKFKQILRNSDEAINLQKKFDEIKKMYGKQGEGK